MRALIGLTAWGLVLLGGAALMAVWETDSGAALVAPICSAVSRTGGTWTWDVWITGPLFSSGLLFLAGVSVLWSRVGIGRGVLRWHAAAFLAGWLALFVALVSPLHRFGEELFTAHMVEHELVMAIAAPLLVLARPGAAFLWAFPRPLRHAIGAAVRTNAVNGIWRWSTRPLVATLLHGAAIWLWHTPPLFDDAVLNVSLHRVQHMSFLLTAILFWWAVIRRGEYGAACGHTFATMTHTGLLGALMALAPRVLYHAQTAGASAWGLTPLEDQQLAGLVMWVPAGTVYAGAALTFMGLWINRSGRTGWKAEHALRS